MKRAREEHKEAEVRRWRTLLLRDLEYEGTCNLRDRRALEILECLRGEVAIALVRKLDRGIGEATPSLVDLSQDSPRKLDRGIGEAPLTIAAKESLE